MSFFPTTSDELYIVPGCTVPNEPGHYIVRSPVVVTVSPTNTNGYYYYLNESCEQHCYILGYWFVDGVIRHADYEKHITTAMIDPVGMLAILRCRVGPRRKYLQHRGKDEYGLLIARDYFWNRITPLYSTIIEGLNTNRHIPEEQEERAINYIQKCNQLRLVYRAWSNYMEEGEIPFQDVTEEDMDVDERLEVCNNITNGVKQHITHWFSEYNTAIHPRLQPYEEPVIADHREIVAYIHYRISKKEVFKVAFLCNNIVYILTNTNKMCYEVYTTNANNDERIAARLMHIADLGENIYASIQHILRSDTIPGCVDPMTMLHVLKRRQQPLETTLRIVRDYFFWLCKNPTHDFIARHGCKLNDNLFHNKGMAMSVLNKVCGDGKGGWTRMKALSTFALFTHFLLPELEAENVEYPQNMQQSKYTGLARMCIKRTTKAYLVLQ